MIDKKRKATLKKLDALYIVHNPLDCFIIYFCVCFTFIRIVYDIYELPFIKEVYLIALIFTIVMGPIMGLWAKRVFKNLKLEDVV